jgi:hypothetical protein
MAPQGPPAPPAKGRPAPPAKGRPPPPPNKGGEASAPAAEDKAAKWEEKGRYQEAAVLYQERGDVTSANRCLKLAIAANPGTVINNIHHGDKHIHDSVVMGDD